ncbi:hypothetical protein AMAG_02078 [Allomyces macrogynus ATCC 38327]|uniref:Uncharacterized protein n=1 Tax=Allomyces macrogynus (strain ATCC 38327) TaxID=578462 RepID=A0A0L0S1G2_ALLM3|nr:hypothetical protein AMAG_02078 [Allomyces macrogynus ATCC 38327]|eukprot:KNE56245.1 hypothetical protein AMAG_02078 [Allomyces macrogynus ATCC 38327]
MPAVQQYQVATILLIGLAMAVVLAAASPAALSEHGHHHAIHATASADTAPRTPSGCYWRSDFNVSLQHKPRPAPNPHRLVFTATNRVTGTRVPWRDLVVMHARRAHVLVVDSNVETLVHVHPEDLRRCHATRRASGASTCRYHKTVDRGSCRSSSQCAYRRASSQKQENTAIVHGLRLATGSDAYTSPIPLTGLPVTSLPQRGHGSQYQVTTAALPDGRAAILPLFQNQCRTVVFHVAQYAAHWHRFAPAADLGPLLDAAAHITAVHASTLHTAHFHGVALALSQVSAADVAHVAAQLLTGTAEATDSRPPTRLTAPPVVAWRRGGSERVQLCRGRVGTRVWMHGAAPASFGPWIGAAVSLPLPGWWRLIVQARVRGGDMVVAAVWVHVKPTPQQ